MTALTDLEAFQRHHSPEGLFRRYARGRVTYFLSRQVIALCGAVSLQLLVSGQVALVVFTIAMFGEIADSGYLRIAPNLLNRGWPLRPVVAVATLTAFFQALTIAFCVAIAWFTVPAQQSVFFSLAFLAGAAINAGIVLPFCRSAAIARMAVYAALVPLLFGLDVYFTGRFGTDHFFDLFGAMMLTYTTVTFTKYVYRAHRKGVRDRHQQLLGQQALADASAVLEERQRELRRLSLVAENTQDAILICDSDTRPIWVNRGFQRITGYDLSDATGKRALDLLKGPQTDTRSVLAIRTAIRQEDSFRTELVCHTVDNRPVWFDMQVVPVRDADDRIDVLIMILHDITEAKEHEHVLADAKRKAEDSERAKSDFLATMSHEIRTPMNRILGMSDLLQDFDLPQEAAENVQTIRSSARALLNIINDILDLSRLEAGKMSIDAAPFDPREVIEQAANLLRPEAQRKGIELRVDFATEIPGLLLGDDGRLRQILLNLVGNAVKFTAAGGVTVTVTAQPGGATTDLTMRVRDTGIGVPASAAASVFERFTQADPALTRQHGGTGLGLTIARMLARHMDGDLWLEQPEDGPGACFVVRVRLPETTAEDRTRPHRSADARRLPEGLRILVAEDNEVNRVVMEKYLLTLKADVSFAVNGREAVAMAGALSPDIVLMDVSMPDMDGLEATRAIRSSGGAPQPVIVALTANAFAEDRERCLAAGMDDFLSKPVSRDDLIEVLARALPSEWRGARVAAPANGI